MRLVFREHAVQDLLDIEARIASEAAERASAFVRRIRRRCERLLAAPHQGRARPDLGADLRSVVVRPYLIVYQVREDAVTIVRVVHGARNLPAVFGEG